MNQTRILSSLLQSVLSSGNFLCRRNLSKKLKPLQIVDQKRKKRWDEFPDFKKIDDPEVRSALENMDMDFEPDLSQFSEQHMAFEREKNSNRLKYRREKLARKHFREFKTQEVNILTWAEKETIRYLNETNPDHWSPENISAAFPISPEGVSKLLKSIFRIHKKEDLIKHDEQVKNTIEKIKSGEIPLTPELEAKMEMRAKIPLQVGAVPPNAKDLLVADKPKPLGEFARLVATPERIKEDEAVRSSPKSEGNPKAFEHFVKDMKKFNISKNEKLTLSNLESKLKTGQSKSTRETWVSSNPEIQYLLRLQQEGPAEPVNASEILEASSRDSQSENFIGKRVQKFKVPENDQDSPLSIDTASGQGYIYNSATGYQKPFGSDRTAQDKIEIPPGKKVRGATYQVGDSFYDENGEFLYRVV